MDKKWEYVINLCAHDYPLKTNFEIVRQLKTLNRHNSVESIPITDSKRIRIANRWLVDDIHHVQMLGPKEPSTFSSNFFAGSAYYIFTKEAIQFILADQKVQAFFEWSKVKVLKGFGRYEVLYQTFRRETAAYMFNT